MNKPLVKILCCLMIFLQFIGCASMPKPTRPAVIEEGAATTIAPVSPKKIDYQLFHKKIAEVEGNIQKFHPQDSAFLSIHAKTVQLDSMQNENEWKNIKKRKKATIIGAAIPAFIGLMYIIPLAGGDSGPGIIAIPIITAFSCLIGSVGGLLFSTGSDIKREHKEDLAGLINEYNNLDTTALKTLVPDSAK